MALAGGWLWPLSSSKEVPATLGTQLGLGQAAPGPEADGPSGKATVVPGSVVSAAGSDIVERRCIP